MLHPPIPSPYAGASQQKVVYISANTPFISATKRVRKLLSLIDKRSMGTVELLNGKGSDKQKLRALGEQENAGKRRDPEEVVLKATGRAIEKALGLALFFQGQEDCRVMVRTGSVGVVDDIEKVEKPGIGDETPIHALSSATNSACDPRSNSGQDPSLPGNNNDRMEDEDAELPETQIRKTSMVEVGVSLL